MYELSGFKFKWESCGEREGVWENLFLTFKGASPKEQFSHGMFFSSLCWGLTDHCEMKKSIKPTHSRLKKTPESCTHTHHWVKLICDTSLTRNTRRMRSFQTDLKRQDTSIIQVSHALRQHWIKFALWMHSSLFESSPWMKTTYTLPMSSWKYEPDVTANWSM